MFCHKCGAQAAEGASFCQKCGAKLLADTSAAPPEQAPAAPGPERLPSSAPSTPPPKKKSKKLPVILGVIALLAVMAAVAIFVILNWEGKIDYEATVRAYKPFNNSQDLPYTCGEVFDKYIPDAAWKVDASDDKALVEISGTAEGTGRKAEITIEVSLDPKDSERALFDLESIRLNGERSSTENEATELLLAMFAAYDNGDDDLSGFDQLLMEVRGEQPDETKPPEPTQAADDPNAETSAKPSNQGGSAKLAEAKKAYAEKVLELTAEYGEYGNLQFDLIDFTGSDVPELVADLLGYHVSVYAWINGEVVPLGQEGWPYGAAGVAGYQYLPGRNLVQYSDSDMAGAIVYDIYMTVNDTYGFDYIGPTLRTEYFRDLNGNGFPDENEFSEEPIYYVDDVEVSEEEYASYQMPGAYQWLTGSMPAEEMLALLSEAGG